MALVEKTVLVHHSASRMFSLVDDIESYPTFLPWCGGASVESKDENGLIHATVMIDFHHVKKSFTTENRREVPNLIEMKLVDGPFEMLEGSWRFIELGESACKIDFRLHYEFSSELLEALVGPIFNMIANSFVDAFTKQAEKVYRK
ncbi:MAG TPA: type II toxin-antitoxin system RatA family toxin [Burkholderiales bacterium]|nr:type II toxin-antitoxin system RatA family toxin [Burkholderiales bacterium]